MIIEKDWQIIVTELRPMSDAPKSGSVLLATKTDTFVIGYRWGIPAEKEKFSIQGVGKYSPDNFLGWLPLPIYQPQQKACKNCGAENAEESKTKCLVTEFGQTCDGMKFYE